MTNGVTGDFTHSLSVIEDGCFKLSLIIVPGPDIASLELISLVKAIDRLQ